MNNMGHNYSGASAKLAALFEANQGMPISRDTVQAVASQLDYMKRLRRNGGARDILDQKGIALLWGKGDWYVISKLGLGSVSESEFIAYTPKDPSELKLLQMHGHAELSSPGFT